jgi:homoserine O-acetyltransferase
MTQLTEVKVKNQDFIYRGDFEFESGEKLSQVKINYTTYGTFDKSKNNVVWICHALTANSRPDSWWPNMIGENFIYNQDDYFVICANVIGACYGSSGPTEINTETGKPYFLSFPKTTIRDMVKALDLLRVELGIEKIHTCVGGSLGGQQALEWAIIQPKLIENLMIMATNAVHSPWGIAFNESQRMAIKVDSTWNEESLEAGKKGLAAARAMALISYRTYETYKNTQSEDDCEKTDNYKAVSYQQYQGQKLIKRFNAHSYIYLTNAMDSHNVGRGRCGVEKALALVQSKTLVVGIRSDILFPTSEQKYLQKHIKGAVYNEIDSFYGHDGFLIETKEITKVIKAFYSLA